MTKSTKTETPEILILTDENLDKLPKGIKEDVNQLTDNLKPKDLAVLNPLVVAMEDLKKINNLTYKEDDKECIQAFKDAKREIGSFNTSLRDAHKEIKKPYYDICKKIDSVKNSFSEESNKVKEGLMKRFKPHLDAEQAKKEARIAKKEAEQRKALEESQKKAKEAAETLKRTQVFNEIKYGVISDFKNNSLSDMNKLSLASVQDFINKLDKAVYQDMIDKNCAKSQFLSSNYSLITEEQQTELQGDFEETIESLKNSFQSRLEELKRLEEENLANAKKEGSFEKQIETYESNAPVEKPQPFGEEVKLPEKPKEVVPEIDPLEALRQKQLTPEARVEKMIVGLKEFHDLVNENKEAISPESDAEYRKILVNMGALLTRAIAYIEPKFNEIKNK